MQVDDQEHCEAQLASFFRTFGADRTIYLELLDDVSYDNIPVLPLDAQHLKSYDDMLYTHLLLSPNAFFEILNNVATSVCREVFPNQLDASLSITVRPYNLGADAERNLRDLSPSDIDTLVKITGMITRVSPVLPEPRRVYYRCSLCGADDHKDLSTATSFELPTSCTPV
ncbi:hypothetical protein GEMRC1_005978 [Eukaryota sp. GEM-RC1]